MNDNLKQEIGAVRMLGKCNMFSWKEVVYIAEQCGFDELVEWLPQNVKIYSNYILTGEVKTDE